MTASRRWDSKRKISKQHGPPWWVSVQSSYTEGHNLPESPSRRCLHDRRLPGDRCPSPYNAIMGRTWQHSIPSTRHQKLKFQLENENSRVKVITVRGDQHMAKQCLMAVVPGEAETT